MAALISLLDFWQLIHRFDLRYWLKSCSQKSGEISSLTNQPVVVWVHHCKVSMKEKWKQWWPATEGVKHFAHFTAHYTWQSLWLTAFDLNPLGAQRGTRGTKALSWEGNDCGQGSTHSIKVLVCWCWCCEKHQCAFLSLLQAVGWLKSKKKSPRQWTEENAFGFLSSSPLFDTFLTKKFFSRSWAGITKRIAFYLFYSSQTLPAFPLISYTFRKETLCWSLNVVQKSVHAVWGPQRCNSWIFQMLN